ncbi:MAG: ribosome biogenesis GTP-binding protein YihA/YsxC [Terriglobales bacterium]
MPAAHSAKRFQVQFWKSCAALSDFPTSSAPEIAVLGRSNVGKSSLLNSLAGADLAHTSRTPGRTRLLNLYQINQGRAVLVDCPGYGYARVSRTERESWAAMIEPYLARRPNLKLALLLVDGMLPPQAMDLDLNAWLREHAIPALVIATKWDRLSGNQRPPALARLRAAYGGEPLPYSARTHLGREDLWARVLGLTAAGVPGAH